MGYSAGGHLALLYAYSTADNYTNPNDNPIKLVISEAGPSYFTGNIIESLPPLQQNEILAMVGGNNAVDLYNASPLNYVTSSAPYTILAYGCGVTCPNGESGDGFLPYSQAALLEALLNPTSSQVGGGTGDNASQIIEGENCILYKLFEVGHGQFGEGGKVYPNTNAQDEELNATIDAYYEKIASKLQFNS